MKFRFKSIIQENQKMSTQFAWLTTVLIAIISLLMAISVINIFVQINHDINQKEKTQDIFTASKIFDKIKDIDSSDKIQMEKELSGYLKDEIIEYVIIKDRKTGRAIYSIDGKRKYSASARNYQVYTPQFITPRNEYVFGFYEKNILKNYINEFLDKLKILTISGIFFGLLMSYFMF